MIFVFVSFVEKTFIAEKNAIANQLTQNMESYVFCISFFLRILNRLLIRQADTCFLHFFCVHTQMPRSLIDSRRKILTFTTPCLASWNCRLPDVCLSICPFRICYIWFKIVQKIQIVNAAICKVKNESGHAIALLLHGQHVWYGFTMKRVRMPHIYILSLQVLEFKCVSLSNWNTSFVIKSFIHIALCVCVNRSTTRAQAQARTRSKVQSFT